MRSMPLAVLGALMYTVGRVERKKRCNSVICMASTPAQTKIAAEVIRGLNLGLRC
jgi:hypothetical protein